MIRAAMSEFLQALRSVFTGPQPVPSQHRRVPRASGAPASDVSASGTVSRLSPPSLEGVAERSPAIDPGLLAAYWREALDYLDFVALARTGGKEVKPLHLYTLAETVAKAALSGTDTEEPQTPGGSEVNVVLCLWARDRNGALQSGRPRHPLLNVPAVMDETGCLAPRLSALPELNIRYFAPDVQAGCFSVGTSVAANDALLSALGEFATDKTVSPGWADWWQACTQALYQATGAKHEQELAALLGKRANESRDKKAQWGLCAAIYPVSGSGAKAVAEVYENIGETGADGPQGLFHRLCGAAAAQDIEQLSATSHNLLQGHIDENEGGRRALFPLDPTQRSAVRAILSLQPGQLQAVNGPPGSGKTAMLRAVVGSKWVAAALLNEPCPIIVACGATNQSVTNVIEAFGKAPHSDDSLPHAQRWIDHAPSYGAFLPSSSYKSDAKNEAEISRTVCIERVENAANAGALYRYYKRTNVLDPAKAFDSESTYLTRARRVLGGDAVHSVEDAVRAVWQLLRNAVAQGQACQEAAEAGRDWTEVGRSYLQAHGALWTETRRDVAAALLAKGGKAAALEFADISWRAEAFHWAARYWEGQFLLAQRERLLSRHPVNVEEALRRLCMLTPCLVSTLHTVPQFAKIDRSVTDQSEQRSHVYGVIDLLVLDEAGQAVPELAGAAFALAKTAAVVGDLKQLAPIATHARLAEIGIAQRSGTLPLLDAIVRSGRSIVSGSGLAMARAVSRWKEATDDGVTLRFHYRCKPSIIEYCNRLCYDRALLPRTKEDALFPEPALGWVNIDATPVVAGGSHLNRDEANAIVEWIGERWPVWQNHRATAGKVLQDVVAIVTPYRPQADYLAQQLQAVFAKARAGGGQWPSVEDIRKVTIGTVHRLQGAERPVVCFSLVEGPEQAGDSFVDRDATLMNVAVSRAKSAFIIFANPLRLFPAAGAAAASEQILAPVHQLGAYLKTRPEAKLLYPEKVVLIEAGGKLTAMQAILGKPYATIATGGALWSLPLNGGVDIRAGFVPRPVLEDGAMAMLGRASRLLETVDEIVFATDDDRMGEYIAWQAHYYLADVVADKRISRARLGAITRAHVARAFAHPSTLDERQVLAEAVREVADWLVTRRLARLRGSVPVCPAAELDAFAQLGACTASAPGKAHAVGRVQGAVLRLLLKRARQAVDASDQYRIRATVRIGERAYTGYAFILNDGRSLTSREAAIKFVSKHDGSRLHALAAPQVYRERCAVPLPGTIDILARAWEFSRIAPWDAMVSLQQLYDGSWSGADAAWAEILEPVPELAGDGGHPPLRPLDRSATPEQMCGSLGPQLHAVYSLVWDYYIASEQGGLTITSATMKYKAGDTFGVCFESLCCDELDGHLQHVVFGRGERQRGAANAGLERHRLALEGMTPLYSAEPAAPWDMRPDQLLLWMGTAQIGRPSTYAAAIERLVSHNLLQFPLDDGPLQLTPDGLATALALEYEEPQLSSPGFSGEMLAMIGRIEQGECGPAEVLRDLMPQLAPEEDPATIGPLIWNNLAQLQAAMAEDISATGYANTLVSRGDA